MTERIYLDHQSTTPVDPRVIEAMLPFLSARFGNPHSAHSFGWEAEKPVVSAQKAVSQLIGADPGEIVFTSGATEANNLALQGVARTMGDRRGHILISSIEHKCILNTAEWLRTQGFDIEFVKVDGEGRVCPADVRKLIRCDTILVSIMMANNEVGTIQPVTDIGAICRERGVLFHTDAAQAVGKIPVDIFDMNIDLLSLSAHKFFGPMGIGALFISTECTDRIAPIMLGGAQQGGKRAGTVPSFLCAGLGAAAEIAEAEMASNARTVVELEQKFLTALGDAEIEFSVNSPFLNKIPGHLNIHFSKMDAEELINRTSGQLSFSTGSACNQGIIEKSYVLEAMNFRGDHIDRSARFGISHLNTEEDIVSAVKIISGASAAVGAMLQTSA